MAGAPYILMCTRGSHIAAGVYVLLEIGLVSMPRSFESKCVCSSSHSVTHTRKSGVSEFNNAGTPLNARSVFVTLLSLLLIEQA